jgi:hypothetical protein
VVHLEVDPLEPAYHDALAAIVEIDASRYR